MIEDLNRALFELEQTRKVIMDYRERIGSLYPWQPDRDIRIIIVNQLNNCLISHNITLKFITSQLMDLNWIKTSLSVPDNHTAFMILEGYVTNNKNGLIYSLSSVIERFFRLVYTAVKDPTSKLIEDYRQIRLKIFSFVGISLESEEWKALAILANIRNTIHNNGIYIDNRNPEINIVYRGQMEIFRNGYPHYSATYRTINLICVDLLNLITKLHQAQQLLLIPSIHETFDERFDWQ